MKSFYLYPGQIHATKEDTVIFTLLGSCVAVALYDPLSKIAGLNHFLLPEPTPHDVKGPRYGTIAIPQLIKEIELLGGSKNKLKAKVFGGGNVIQNVLSGPSIGELNFNLAFQLLTKLDIPVVEKNVGGNRPRTIKFNTHTFEVIHHFSDERASK